MSIVSDCMAAIASKEPARAELAVLSARFLADGGKVQYIDSFVPQARVATDTPYLKTGSLAAKRQRAENRSIEERAVELITEYGGFATSDEYRRHLLANGISMGWERVEQAAARARVVLLPAKRDSKKAAA